MTAPHNDNEELLHRAAQGDQEACRKLLEPYRERLRQLLAVRMDRRLAARLDSSDVIQEALADAWQQLADYLVERPVAFYPWLRQVTLDRLARLHNRHLGTQKRSLLREQGQRPALSDESIFHLAQMLVASGTSPSGRMQRHELFSQVEEALAQLPERDREILVLRHLEQLSVAEMSSVLGISESAVKVRHFRALQRIRTLLPDMNDGTGK
jgi:RNA polymerase sigma-70 factor (ECF subfamily)